MNQCRRDFIKGIATTGAFAAFANAFAELRVFTTGIENEKVLKIKPLEIDLGLGKAFKAFHFSDTHLNFFDAEDFSAVPKRKKDHYHHRWCRFPQSLESFYASIDYARSHGLPMLHTGDLVDFQSKGNERVLEHNVSGLDLHYAIGNHEYQDQGPEVYTNDRPGARRRLSRYIPNNNNLDVASKVIGGANFVAFDHSQYKQLREETIEGVKKEFEKGLPVVLMCHIPLEFTRVFRENSHKAVYRSSVRAAKAKGEEPPPYKELPPGPDPDDDKPKDKATREFYDWLRTRKDLKAILCGHTHIAEIDDFSETAKMYVAGGNYSGYAYEITFK